MTGFEKRELMASFNAAAEGYPAVSVLQDQVGEGLLERLELMKIAPATLLDLGSGPGGPALALRRKYPHAWIVQLDIAENMLRAARRTAGRPRAGLSWLCADAERLPLAGKSVDLVFSNLMLQWCRDPAALYRGVAEILRPGGLFLFSSLGPDTLIELRESWAEADDGEHVHTFLDMHDLGDALIRAGLQHPVMETDRLILSYDDVGQVLADLKGLGAHNISGGRRRTLTGKHRFERMREAYEARRRDGRIPATYEVVYGHAWAAGPAAARPRKNIATIPLESLRRMLRGRTP